MVNIAATNPKNTMIKTENNELSNLGYLDSLNELLGISGVTGKTSNLISNYLHLQIKD